MNDFVLKVILDALTFLLKEVNGHGSCGDYRAHERAIAEAKEQVSKR